MKLYKAKVDIYDANDPNQEVIVKQGQLLTFEDEKREQKAVKNGIVEVFDYYHLEGGLDEEVEEEAENTEVDYNDYKVDELKDLLKENEIEFDSKANKDELVELAKSNL